MLATIVTVLGAVIATLLMASLMYALIWDGFQHGDVIRLIGTDITNKPKRFFSAGMIIYLTTGLALCWLYYMTIQFLNIQTFLVSAGVGGAIGFVTGFAMMYWFIYEVFAIQEVNQQYAKYWIPTAIAHWFGHMAFGFSLGTMISAFVLYGMNSFWLAAALNLVAAGGIMLFAKKTEIIDSYHRRQAHG
ncbi:MAG TPA: hypothetical protein VFO10_05355 [Oligoflexus sp.]|uniref:hypothetical protein n=1 Tax=Oligoflexus sp. TaxID=1971216 RepID=UPI002D7E1FC9|nr:hypothetical protein [Oligoflexus sp.]HET9236652.1 hypothetical protein [Oligoflexus sp.]